MADVTYNTSSFPALLQTLASLLLLSAAAHHSDDDDDGIADDDIGGGGDCDSGLQERGDRGGHDPLVLLAYKERDPGQRQLWNMMTRETGVVLKCVGKQAGAGVLLSRFGWGKERK